jgi:hypothetical protein
MQFGTFEESEAIIPMTVQCKYIIRITGKVVTEQNLPNDGQE